MGGKGGGQTTVTENADPWVGQQPYLQDIFSQASNLFQNRPEFFPGRTYVPFSQQTEGAMGMGIDRAMAGLYGGGGGAGGGTGYGGADAERTMQNWVTQTMQNPGGQQTEDYLQSVMGGDYLNSNPWLDQTYSNAAEALAPSINATFGGAGRTGGGTHGLSLGKGMGQLAADLYGGNYQAERDRMMQAAGHSNTGRAISGQIQQGAASLAPTAAGFDWNNIAQIANIGNQVEGKAGEVLGDSMNRHGFYQTGGGSPEQALARYVAAIQGNYGGSQVGTTDAAGNPVAGAAGGALTGAAVSPALSSAMGGASLGPWGAIIGGLLGALGSR